MYEKAEAYLMRYLNAEKALETDQKILEVLEAKVDPSKSYVTANSRERGAETREDRIIKVLALKETIANEQEEVTCLLDETIEMINRLSDKSARWIMISAYVYGEPQKNIAIDANTYPKKIRDIIHASLQEVEGYLSEKFLT